MFQLIVVIAKLFRMSAGAGKKLAATDLVSEFQFPQHINDLLILIEQRNAPTNQQLFRAVINVTTVGARVSLEKRKC